MGSFSYDPDTDIGFARSRLGDTQRERAFFEDEEIQAAINRAGSVLGALYSLCLHAAAESVRRASSRSTSDKHRTMTFDDSRQPEHWRKLSEIYKPHATTDTVVVESFFETHGSDGLTALSRRWGR